MSRPADLIISGRVATLAGEEGFGWQAGVALRDGLVVATGPPAELTALAGPRTERWALGEGLAVMPAITDSHAHLMLMVLAERQVDLADVDDLEATLAVLERAHAERAATGDRDSWLLGRGWSMDRLGEWPTGAALERVAPGRPIALYAHDHHSRWASPAALALAGVSEATPDSAGGVIRRDEDGRPTGILHETAASLLDSAIPDPTDEELVADLGRVAAKLAALGISGVHDPGELSGDTELRRGPLFYRRLAESGRLPLRVHASVRAPQLTRAIELGLRSGDGCSPADGTDTHLRRLADRYRMGWLKLFADGSLGSRSAAMLEPYSDAAERPPTGGPRGMFLATAAELADQLGRASAAGIVGQVHAIGDAGVRLALDLLAELSSGRLMRRIEHAQLVHPLDQPRFGRLGVAASVHPVHLRSDAEPARQAWGERSHHAFPLGGLLRGGALIPLGSDAPVEPVDPWPGIAVAVSRREPTRPTEGPLGAEHAIDLARAIRAACLDPAVVSGEPRLGRLAPGAPADLLVVPAEALGEPVDAARLAATRPLATLLDGEFIYRAVDFDP